MNRLWGTRVYMSGSIDKDEINRGRVWRQELTPFLHNIGCVVLDPTNKPISLIQEQPEDIERRKELKRKGLYNDLQKEMKLLRCVDLRCVDLSDILIVYLDLDIAARGTYEEMDWANRCKKPILLCVKQGKSALNDWNFGIIPHEHIFSNWEELKQYMLDVDSGKDERHFKRFFFFDYDRLLPNRPPNTQNDGKKYSLAWL